MNQKRYYQITRSLLRTSHFTELFLLKSKSEAANNIINYCRKLETNFGDRCVRRIRCDNAGELSTNAIGIFCLKRGITLEYTVPN